MRNVFSDLAYYFFNFYENPKNTNSKILKSL